MVEPFGSFLVLASSLRSSHVVTAWVVVVANGVAGCWALAAHWRSRWRRPQLWWFIAGAEVAIVVQACLGVALVARDDRDPPQFHMFYGFVAVAAVGIIYSYRQQVPQRHLLYGLGSLFLMGLAIRALFIDPA